MENTEDTMATPRIKNVLNERIDQLTKQQKYLLSRSLNTVIILFVILVIIFLVFSKKDLGNFHLDENAIRLLWIIVIMDIAGLVLIVMRAFQQLKRYKTCIIRLDTLLFKVTIKNEYSEEKLNEEEICNEMESIMSVLEHDK